MSRKDAINRENRVSIMESDLNFIKLRIFYTSSGRIPFLTTNIRVKGINIYYNLIVQGTKKYSLLQELCVNSRIGIQVIFNEARSQIVLKYELLSMDGQGISMQVVGITA